AGDRVPSRTLLRSRRWTTNSTVAVLAAGHSAGARVQFSRVPSDATRTISRAVIDSKRWLMAPLWGNRKPQRNGRTVRRNAPGSPPNASARTQDYAVHLGDLPTWRRAAARRYARRHDRHLRHPQWG